VTCDARIAADDHRLYGMNVELELPGNDRPATIEAQFSDYNAPITIEPPADVVP
jgi:hypothetical protein